MSEVEISKWQAVWAVVSDLSAAVASIKYASAVGLTIIGQTSGWRLSTFLFGFFCLSLLKDSFAFVVSSFFSCPRINYRFDAFSDDIAAPTPNDTRTDRLRCQTCSNLWSIKGDWDRVEPAWINVASLERTAARTENNWETLADEA